MPGGRKKKDGSPTDPNSSAQSATMPSGHGSKLEKRMDQVLAALISCPTLREAAFACNISPCTITRWLQIPEFRARHEEVQQEILKAAVKDARGLFGIGLQTLREIAESGEDERARVSAATKLVDIGFKTIELDEIKAKVEELRRKVDGEPPVQPQ